MLMGTYSKFPLTHDELAPLLDADGFARFPATFAEYWDVLEKAEYRVDFYQNEIIATMSYEADLHSHFMMHVGSLLRKAFPSVKDFRVHGSNRPVYCPSVPQARIFNPDGCVVPQPSIPFQYRPGMSAEATPLIILEILSKSTRRYDFNIKLPCYQQVPALRCILYLEALRSEVKVWNRQSAEEAWAEATFTQPEDQIQIASDKHISLRDIYAGIYF